MVREEHETLTSIRSGGFNFGAFLSWCNTFAVTILAVAVGFLFVQLQVITLKVAQTQHHIDQVLDKVTSQQQEQIETLTTQVEEEHSLTILHMALIFTTLTCLVSMFHMSAHLRNFNQPMVQRKIVAILWMSPIYAVTSFLSLLWPAAEGYLAILKDLYEAYVIYQFLAFLIAVLGQGDRDVAVGVLALHSDHLDKPAKCLSCFYHPPPNESPAAKANAVLMECMILCMQFVFLRPLTSIATFVCEVITMSDAESSSSSSANEQDTTTQVDVEADAWAYFKSPLFYIAMIQNVSVFFAFSGLLKFYHAVREDLQWCQPFSKFLVIKGVVFMTFWQGLVISIVCNLHQGGQWSVTDNNETQNPRQKAIELQNVLICLEMLFFSIAHVCVFPTDEWEEGYAPQEYAKPGIGLKDFVSDMSLIVESTRASRRAKKNKDEQVEDDEEVGIVTDNQVVDENILVVVKERHLD
jgi:hypothetical protein